MSLIVHTIPSLVGESQAILLASSQAATFDVAINGMQFQMKPTVEIPYLRESAQFRKEQFDASPEAGEQSLAFWWVRSQLSFHGGAGQKYLDTNVTPTEESRIRFDTSRNVDVWTPGIVTRLPDTTVKVAATAPVAIEATRHSGVSCIIQAEGSTLKAYRQTTIGDAGTTTNYTWGATDPILSLATDGTSYYVATVNGIYKGPVDGTVAGALVYTLAGGTTFIELGWVKQRLMLGHGRKLYELAVPGPALPTALFEHPTTGWQWTAFAEAPTGILASGHAGLSSVIYKATITDVSGTPTLGAPSVTAVMPVGEQVLTMHASVGSVLGIGTNKGIRIGQFDIYYGNLTYGPLTVETVEGVSCLTSRDRFLYGGYARAIDGAATPSSGLVRIDLGHPTDQEGRYAWASDILPPTESAGDVVGVSVSSFGRIAFSVAGVGLCLEGIGPGLFGKALLQTSRIRFATTEPKLFKFGSVQGTFTAGKLKVLMVTENQAARAVFAYGPSLIPPPRFGLLGGALEWGALIFELIGFTASMRSYQIQALPGSRRQKLIQLPLMCFDFEVDRAGRSVGHKGHASERLLKLESLERAGDEVTLQSFAGLGTQDQVVIEQLTFRQVAPPTDVAGMGGMAIVVLRTV